MWNLNNKKKRKSKKNNKFIVITANPLLSKNNVNDIKTLTDESNKKLNVLIQTFKKVISL